MTRYLSRPEVSDYVRERGLEITKATLAKMATVGGGPKYRLFGKRAYYDPCDIDSWIAKRLTSPRVSTSDHQV